MSKVAPLGPDLSGGHAVRQSAGGGGGAGDAAAPEGASGDLRRNWKRAPPRCAPMPPAGVTVNRVGSMFTFFFTDQPVTDWESREACDTARFGRFFHAMLERGDLPRAIAVRSGVRFRRAHRRRYQTGPWKRPAIASPPNGSPPQLPTRPSADHGEPKQAHGHHDPPLLLRQPPRLEGDMLGNGTPSRPLNCTAAPPRCSVRCTAAPHSRPAA